MWRHMKLILQVVALATTMLVSCSPCSHVKVLGRATKCSITFYLVYTMLPNYNRVTRKSAHTPGWNFKSDCGGFSSCSTDKWHSKRWNTKQKTKVFSWRHHFGTLLTYLPVLTYYYFHHCKASLPFYKRTCIMYIFLISELTFCNSIRKKINNYFAIKESIFLAHHIDRAIWKANASLVIPCFINRHFIEPRTYTSD